MSDGSSKSLTKVRSTPPVMKRDSSSTLPSHLVSVTNQVKGSIEVKQQIPLKLAKLSGSGSSATSGKLTGSASCANLAGSLKYNSSGGIISSSQDPKSNLRNDQQILTSSSQVLPVKLIENFGKGKKGTTSQGSEGWGTKSLSSSSTKTGYHRLHSLPDVAARFHSAPPSLASDVNKTILSFQNGSNNSAVTKTSSYSPSSTPGPPTPSRTNTCPRLSTTKSQLDCLALSKSSTDSEHSNKAFYRRCSDNSLDQICSGSVSESEKINKVPDYSSTRPGQRIKDPVTNQDIIFF